MKNFEVMQDDNGYFLLIHANHPEKVDYAPNYFKQFCGRLKQCMEFIEEFWDENFIRDEDRILLTVK